MEDTLKPLAPVNAAPMLGYVTEREFERAVFWCIGFIGIGLAGAQIAKVFFDIISAGVFMQPPRWLTSVLELSRRPQSFMTIIGGWQELVDPIATPIVSLFLLAGSIGCFRRDPKTRFWMISYSVLHLILVLGSCAIGFLNDSGFARMIGFDRAYYYFGRGVNGDPWFSIALGYVAVFLSRTAFDIVIFWLMTRPYVAEVFRRPKW